MFLREKDPYKRGFAHGSFLREEIEDETDFITHYVQNKLGWASAKFFMKIVFRKTNNLKKEYTTDEIEEMKGISEGSGVALEWVLLFNSIYEIAIAFRSTFVGCSFFAAPFKKTENVLIGKTTDLYFEKKVTEFISKRRFIAVYDNNELQNKFIAPSLPGLLITDSVITKKGTLFAVNDGGGAHKGFDFDNTPIVSIAWGLTKLASNSRIWLKALKKVSSIRPFACLVSDGERQNTFLVEMCQGDYFVERMNGVLVNTNHFVSEEMKNKWYVKNYENHKEYNATLKRGENIKKEIKDGVSSTEEAIKIMKIHEKTFSPRRGSVSNNGTVQGFIYIPQERKILFPAGNKVPVTFNGEWQEFFLDEIFSTS